MLLLFEFFLLSHSVCLITGKLFLERIRYIHFCIVSLVVLPPSSLLCVTAQTLTPPLSAQQKENAAVPINFKEGACLRNSACSQTYSAPSVPLGSLPVNTHLEKSMQSSQVNGSKISPTPSGHER